MNTGSSLAATSYNWAVGQVHDLHCTRALPTLHDTTRILANQELPQALLLQTDDPSHYTAPYRANEFVILKHF